MDDKIKIVLECLEEEMKESANKGETRVISVNEIGRRLEYNVVAKAYDFIYGIRPGEFETSDIISILNNVGAAYNYQGKIKNSSKKLLFEGTVVAK